MLMDREEEKKKALEEIVNYFRKQGKEISTFTVNPDTVYHKDVNKFLKLMEYGGKIKGKDMEFRAA